MTEDQAENTRCCGPEGCGEPRASAATTANPFPRFCIASDCMAWRLDATGEGYCGLAGVPLTSP